MKLTARNTHRDIAYFYLGLIIAFSFSGIFLNHRQAWHPRRYTYNAQEIQLKQTVVKDSVNDKFIAAFTQEYKIDDQGAGFDAQADEDDPSHNAQDCKGEVVVF